MKLKPVEFATMSLNSMLIGLVRDNESMTTYVETAKAINDQQLALKIKLRSSVLNAHRKWSRDGALDISVIF